MTAVAGRIRAKSVSVNSGLSGSVAAAAVIARSSSRLGRRIFRRFILIEFFISQDLATIGFPQTDDPYILSAEREYHHVKTLAYKPRGNEARFAVGASRVRDDACRLPFEIRCQPEIYPVFGKIARALRLIPDV